MKSISFVRTLVLLVGYCGLGTFARNVYINWHFNAGVGGPYDTLFKPTNNVEDSFLNDRLQSEEFMSGLQALKDIVKKSSSDGMRLRPYGSRWSATNLPYTEDYMIDTRALNYAKIGIEDDDFVAMDYQGERKERLAFVQSGVRLKFLYRALFDEGLTLPTSCTTDGQTMGGGISTGAHNAGIHFGAMQDFVKGIHLVLLNQTVFLQRKSDPIVTDSYMVEIGADELITDDDLFNAALVSFGTFGVVHAYVIETEKLFRVEGQVRRWKYVENKQALSSLDIGSFGFDLDDPSEEVPWHFEALVNPYHLEAELGSAVRIMKRIPLSDEEIQEIKDTADSYNITYYGKDLQLAIGEQFNTKMEELPQGILENVEPSFKRAFYGAINEAAILAMMFYGGLFEKTGFPLEVYGDPLGTATDFFYIPVSTTTMEPCVALADLDKILSVILDVMYRYPSPTALHVRYLKASNATLAPARFEGINACIALNAVDNKETRLAYIMVQRALEDHRDSIAFAYHWGKNLPMNDEWAAKSHGAALDNWKMQRERLLTPEMRRLFSNEYTDTIGLTG